MKILSTYNICQYHGFNEFTADKISNKQYLSVNDKGIAPSFRAGAKENSAAIKKIVALLGMSAGFLIDAATNNSKKTNVDIYNQILSDPVLMQKYMQLVTDGISHFISSNSDENSNVAISDTEVYSFDEIYKKLNENYQHAMDEIRELKQQTADLKSTISTLEGQKYNAETLNLNLVPIQPLQQDEIESASATITDVTEVWPSDAEISPDTKVKLIFPKKNPDLKSQNDLKKVVESLTVPAKIGIKIIKICNKLIDECVKTNPQYDNTINLTTALRDKLLFHGTDAEMLNQITDDYYNFLKLTTENSDINLINDMIKDSESKSLEVHGTVDLSKYKKYQYKNNNSCKDFLATTIIKRKDNATNHFLFQIPGTVDDNIMNDLQRMLYSFEYSVEKEYGAEKWMYRHPVDIAVQPYFVKKEMKYHSDNDITTAYNHIDDFNYEDIMVAINADPRFHEMFSLHGAMRLIDRFVDFKSNVPFENQCEEILNQLIRAIQKAFKTGIELEPHLDLKHNAYGYKFTLDPSIYDDDMKNVLGTFPVTIAMCENQPMGRYEKENKYPLISTIYPKGYK